MKIYLVGGAVRDALLGLPIKEKDWVVVGASPKTLIAQGFQPVGKDFPVFLHPKTHEEYALARTERKVSQGYHGFTFYTGPKVTLEEDLKRRDLTINAMAKQENQQQIIDPYHGQQDLEAKRLRHISSAFAEDPVRILRVARFAAKLPDFSVDPHTNQLMQHMVSNGEVNTLVAERVWQEFVRALGEQQPRRFFEVLQDCGALTILFPMLDLNSAGMSALNRATTLSTTPSVRFAALVHDMDPHALSTIISRYRIPKKFSELASLSNQLTNVYKNILEADPASLLQFIKKTDALRRPQRFYALLESNRASINDPHNLQRHKHLDDAIDAIKNSDTASLKKQRLKGKEFADALEKQQITALQNLLKKKSKL